MLVIEDITDRAACFGAGVVRSKNASAVAGGETTNCGMEASMKDCRCISPCQSFVVIGGVGVSGVGEGGGHDVVDQGIYLPLMPEVKALGIVLLDVLDLNASMFAMKDAGHEDQRALEVPFAFLQSLELQGHEANDLGSNLSLGWKVELMWVCS